MAAGEWVKWQADGLAAADLSWPRVAVSAATSEASFR